MKFSTAVVLLTAQAASAFSPSSSFTGNNVAAPKSESALDMKYTVAVVGSGPSGACAAEIFAQEKGINTVLFERKMDNAKPCGGAIPLCMVGEFDIPESVVDRKVCNFIKHQLIFHNEDIVSWSNS
jgi:ribulose 1,5-bisphosphate synthetase/thiazole synthase